MTHMILKINRSDGEQVAAFRLTNGRVTLESTAPQIRDAAFLGRIAERLHKYGFQTSLESHISARRPICDIKISHIKVLRQKSSSGR
jgi:hypothetical protein